MKIAITSTGTDLNSALDPRFGRARSFIVFDLDSGDFEAVDNAQNLNAVQGAGIQAAKTVSDLGVGAVITGNCGPKAFVTLRSAKIKVFLCSDMSVKDAIEKYKSGELKDSGGANVEGHWA